MIPTEGVMGIVIPVALFALASVQAYRQNRGMDGCTELLA